MRLIDAKWEIIETIYSCGSSTVVKVSNIQNEQMAAAKVEQVRKGRRPALQIEREFYQAIDGSHSGFPHTYYYGHFEWPPGIKAVVLVMTLLGPSLRVLCSKQNSKFSPMTVLMIGVQGLSRIHLIHELGYVHRDIKHENMLIGKEQRNIIYMIDFGLSNKYKNAYGEHIVETGGRGLIGTMKYASLNEHRGIISSRRDDLESFGYSLIELLVGTLPWSHATDSDTTKCLKRNTRLEELCQNSPAMLTYFRHVRGLGFSEEPNYVLLASTFESAIEKRLNQEEKIFDWMDM